MKDREVKPIDTAIYWTEYIIRHNGAPHLKVGGVYFPWYKYYLIDVLGALIFIFLFILYISKKIIFIMKSKLLKITNLQNEKQKKCM